MAFVKDALASLTGSEDEKRKITERLNFLTDTVKYKLKIQQDLLAQSLLGDGGGIEKLYIVPETVTRFDAQYQVGASSEVNDGISKAIDAFFKGGDDIKAGFKEVIKSSLDILLSSTRAGESEKQIYAITMEHNAFIRVDAYVWKYYFEQKGLSDTIEQAVCYVFCKSVIDHKKVSADVMVNIISEQVGDDIDKVKAFIKKLRDLWDFLQNETPANTAARVRPLLA